MREGDKKITICRNTSSSFRINTWLNTFTNKDEYLDDDDDEKGRWKWKSQLDCVLFAHGGFEKKIQVAKSEVKDSETIRYSIFDVTFWCRP